MKAEKETLELEMPHFGRAAAIAFFGWYLIVPPTPLGGGAHAPLSKWLVLPLDLIYPNMGSDLIVEYRALDECQEVLDDYRKGAPGFSSAHALCIEGNDSRFRGNALYTGK
jgi:hypothetical protein